MRGLGSHNSNVSHSPIWRCDMDEIQHAGHDNQTLNSEPPRELLEYMSPELSWETKEQMP